MSNKETRLDLKLFLLPIAITFLLSLSAHGAPEKREAAESPHAWLIKRTLFQKKNPNLSSADLNAKTADYFSKLKDN